MAPKKVTLEFALERETKGTRRFQEQGVKDGERAVVGTLYVLKPTLETLGNPTTLKVTIEPGD